MTGDYDQLSELGREQARRLGPWLARWARDPAHVLVGPRKRHRETYEEALATARDAGAIWPDPEAAEGLARGSSGLVPKVRGEAADLVDAKCIRQLDVERDEVRPARDAHPPCARSHDAREDGEQEGRPVVRSAEEGVDAAQRPDPEEERDGGEPRGHLSGRAQDADADRVPDDDGEAERDAEDLEQSTAPCGGARGWLCDGGRTARVGQWLASA